VNFCHSKSRSTTHCKTATIFNNTITKSNYRKITFCTLLSTSNANAHKACSRGTVYSCLTVTYLRGNVRWVQTLIQKATWMNAVGIVNSELMWNEFCGDSSHARSFSQHCEESSYAFSHFFSYFAYCLFITYMNVPWPLLHLHLYVRRGRAARIWPYSHDTQPL